MNTIFRFIDDDQDVSMSMLFDMPPEELLGHPPKVGGIVTIGTPDRPGEQEKDFVIVSVAPEIDEDGPACVLDLKVRNINLH